MAPAGLYEPRSKAARAFLEPLRPGDAQWRARNGELRDDFGPFFPIREFTYPDGTPAIQRQEDGSGFALYPTGRKAVCTLCRNRSRRVAAILYSDYEFCVESAVPPRPEGSGLAATAGGGAGDTLGATASRGRRPPRTRHLGALDEWGIGRLDSVPDAKGARSTYEVTSKVVSVRTAAGQLFRIDRSNAALLKANAEQLKLRLNKELLVFYDVNNGITVIDFTCEGVQQSFHIGEVWRAPADDALSPAHVKTHPREIIDTVKLDSQQDLDVSRLAMTDKASAIKTGLKIATGHLKAEKTLIPGELGTSNSAPTLGSFGGTGGQDSSMSLTVDRSAQFKFEHLMKKKVSQAHPKLARPNMARTLVEGFTHPRPPIPRAPHEPDYFHKPCTLEHLSAGKVEERAQECESKGYSFVVLVVADWATGSCYSSCMHARNVCEAAYGELKAKNEAGRLVFAVAEMSEAGGVHASTRWANPLVEKYGVKHAPWMLIFNNGQCVFSDRPTADGLKGTRKLNGAHLEGGLGFAARLRDQPAFAKPRCLVVEPALDGPKAANSFKLQLETQDVLKRAGFEFDLALSTSDARRMAVTAEPAYGMLLASSEVGSGAFCDISDRLRHRCKEAACFLCHDEKSLGTLDPSLQALGDVVQGIFTRPLSKSSLEKMLRPMPACRVNYPKCGMTKGSLVELIRGKISLSSGS